MFSTCPHNMVNFGLLTAEIHPVVEQRAPPVFGRATITLGIGPHSSIDCGLNMLRLRLANFVCSPDGTGPPHSPHSRTPLSLRSISVIERARSAVDNPDDEHGASNGVQLTRQMSVSSAPQLETVANTDSGVNEISQNLHRTILSGS